MADEKITSDTISKGLANYIRLGFVVQTELRKLLQRLVTDTLAGREAGFTTTGRDVKATTKRLAREPLSDLLQYYVEENSHLYRLLNPTEREFITNSKGNHVEFNIHLLFKIYRFSNYGMPPSRMWCELTEVPPMWNEYQLGDTVERIRALWNDIIYRTSTDVSDEELNQYCDVFEDIAMHFENHFDKPYGKFIKLIKDAKETAIDKETGETILSQMKAIADREKQYGRIERDIFVPYYYGDKRMEAFFRKVLLKPAYSDSSSCLKNIPQDVQASFDEKIQAWRTADDMYVNTSASQQVMDVVKANQFVTITGTAGSGKTFLSRHTALELTDKGYCVIPVEEPEDLMNYYEPGKFILFVIDDIGGKFAANAEQIEKWQQIMPVFEIIAHDPNCKIVSTCRSNVFDDKKFEAISNFKTNKVDISEGDLRISLSDIELFIKKFGLKHVDGDALSDQCDFIPLLFSLCISLGKDECVFGNPLEVFCRDPWLVMRNELDNMLRRGTEGASMLKLCSLLLCVLLNNKLEETWFDQSTKISSFQRQTLDAAFKWCGLSMETSRLDVKEALGQLENSFLVKEFGYYRVKHNKVFDFLSYYFGQKMVEFLIENSSSDMLHERFILPHINNSPSSSIEFMIQLPNDSRNETSYCQRLAMDLTSGRGALTIGNQNMTDPAFRQVFLQYLESLPEPQRISIAREKSSSGPGLLVLTCQYAYHDVIQWLLRYGAPVDVCGSDGTYPLHVAAQTGNTELLLSLLENEPNVNVQNSKGNTPLYFACEKNHEKIAAKLLEKGADVNLCDFEGENPLSIACYKDYTDLALMLLKQNIDVNHSIITGDTALHTVCFNNNETLIRSLLEKNPKMTLLNESGETPLTILVEKGTPEDVAILLEKDFDVDTASRYSDTALMTACKLQEPEPIWSEKVCMLIERGANVNQKNKGGIGHTPLYYAINKESFSVAKLLLEAGCDLDCEDDNDPPLLVQACNEGHTEIVKILLDKGVDPNMTDEDGATPLYWACADGNVEMTKNLLEKGADVNLADDDGITPLHVACHEKNSDVVPLLIEHGADVNHEVHDGDRPIFAAACSGSDKTAKLLLTNGAETNMFIKSRTALKKDSSKSMNKIEKSWYDTIMDQAPVEVKQYMEERSPSFLLDIICESSPLHIACFMGHIAVVQCLIQHNVDVNITKRSNSTTPLIYACEVGHRDIVKLLLESGANTEVTDANGKKPIEIVTENGHNDIKELF